MHEQTISFKAYQSDATPDWCRGCGDFGILRALEKALAQLRVERDRLALFGGIGCSGKTPYYLNGYGVHTLHGRLLPFAVGAKLARPELTVLALGGDGDGLSIGAGHFVNAGRRNVDLTYILFNNGVYGLTKGQAAPTLGRGEQLRTMAEPNLQGAVNPILLALTAGFSWVGRGYAYDVRGLVALIADAIAHPGLAYLDVLQPCPVYNDLHTEAWYAGNGQPRLYDLAGAGHDALIPAGGDAREAAAVRAGAFARAQEWGERVPLGVFLRDLSQPLFGAAAPAAEQRPAGDPLAAAMAPLRVG